MDSDMKIRMDEKTGQVVSAMLYGQELLDTAAPCESELWVNGLPLAMRPHVDPNDPTHKLAHLKGERFVDQFSGWGLVLSRHIGERANLTHHCIGIETRVRRELADQTCPCPGPGGPVVEAPLYVDSFSILNWNWKFWGEDTRMMFASSHSSGPADEFGHVGYDNDTPEQVKKFMQNVWRRIYPGCMVIHGGVFYNVKTGQWLALTCRRPQVGYIVNIENAGRGVSYDFTLHAPFAIGDTLLLPEIKLYYGPDHESMMQWLGHYASFYYQEPPAWVHKTLFRTGLAWDNQPTWTQQADYWEKELDDKAYSGIGYCLVTNRPILSGTTPLGYEPDPNHGTIDEFKAMAQRMARRHIPVLVWMSHSGLAYQGSPDYDDDWFIRGIDGRICAAWGSIDEPSLAHINPGHPGYIEYTKKWIRFYIKECGCKGIFFDCLSWAFPPDFRPRPFMRYPGDTNRMAIRFMEEVYACIKECDPEAIMLGEGTSLDGPVNVFSINTNPVRSIDGLSTRDFFLDLNRYSPKRFTIDQGPRMFPASGFCGASGRPEMAAANRYLTQLLKQKGGRDAFTALPGDLSVMDNLLFVPMVSDEGPAATRTLKLPAPFDHVRSLADELGKASFERDATGCFQNVPAGVYRMEGVAASTGRRPSSK